MLSGAVLDPSTLRDLIPDFKEKGAPLAAEVHDEDVLLLTRVLEDRAADHPAAAEEPRQLHHFAQPVRSLAHWPGRGGRHRFLHRFAGQDVLMDGERVIGVRTGDRGIDKHGAAEADLRAWRRHPREGDDLLRRRARQPDEGADAAAAARRQGRSPQQFALGLKELWEIPPDRLKPGTVIHTLGYPLRHEEFGGGFHLRDAATASCRSALSSGLDYKDPLFDPHMAFNRFKQHPFVSSLLAGGQMIRYGAKALPEGGWNTIPQRLHGRRAHRRRRRRHFSTRCA